MTCLTPSSETPYARTDCLELHSQVRYRCFIGEEYIHLRVDIGALELIGDVTLGEKGPWLRIEDSAFTDPTVRASQEHKGRGYHSFDQIESTKETLKHTLSVIG